MREASVTTNSPQLTVVMIFLNGEAFIEEAIESVLAQTFTDWELLLVDDGSTDGSTGISKAYAEAHPGKIRYVNHRDHANCGTGASRNLGIRSAHGNYVAFLDADDVFLPRRLERHMAVFDEHPEVELVISGDLYWHSWRESSTLDLHARDQVIAPWAPANLVLQPPQLLALTLGVRGAPMPCTCGITFLRESAIASGGIPPQFVDQYEDQALICQLMVKCPAMVLNECLARYRQHPDSLTRKARLKGEYRPDRAHRARFAFLQWLQAHLREQGIVHVDAVLHRELWPLRHPTLHQVHESFMDLGRLAKRFVLAPVLRLLPRSVADSLIEAHIRRRQSRRDKRAARLPLVIDTSARRR